MKPVARHLESQLRTAARSFAAVVLTGPRRCGKTWLLQHLFPKASYWLFEDPDLIARFRADPHGLLDDIQTPAILDEVQNIPEIFDYLRARIDRTPRRVGQWFLTGSQESGLMRNVSESMTGRAAILHLAPLSFAESDRVSVLRGGFPEVLARPKAADIWFSSYLQTYLERDVRSVSAVQDLAKFRRFLALLATRHGQLLNRTDLAAPLGMSVPGVSNWLDILELTGQILLIPPYFENAGKRLLKSPKLYFSDSGLACHLLGIRSAAELERSPFLGAIFEGFVAAEIVKSQSYAGERRALYHFRDQQGLEVDFLMPLAGGRIRLIEAKATRTPVPDMAAPMEKLASALRRTPGAMGGVDAVLVHRPARSVARTDALRPGVQALPWDTFVLNPAADSRKASIRGHTGPTTR
ncbi:MAG: ATP-binding protein [Betaproteobacteria bacterium]